MEPLVRHYPDWKAPSEDGELVIWPPPADLLRDITQNHRLLTNSDAILLQNVPLPELRKRMRQFIGHEDDCPLVATGHQTELHHAGVWVKNILINLLADRLNGQAFHIAIDTDGPKHLSVRWPGESVPITDDPRFTTAAWSGLLDPPTPAHLQDLNARLSEAEHGWSFQPVLPEFLGSLRRLSLESANLPSAITNAMHELDWSLGLRHHVLLASPIWLSEPYLVFVNDLLSQADVVAHQYNESLAVYRAAHGIRTRSRPMPDLFTSDESCEMPFWLDDLHSGKRIRPSVFRTDGGWILELTDGQSFTFDPRADGWESATQLQRWLASVRCRITPRALTNMLFLRLVMVDQFIHGIGGGRYDQVTDRFIASHYRMTPPMFGVTTATLYFPEALGRQRACVACVKHEGHRLKHSLLGERKRELVGQIAAMPRHSPQRSAAFFQMHNELATAAARGDALQRWQQRLRETEEHARHDQTLFDRELFYAIQPRDRLLGMIERYRSQLHA